MAKVTAVILLIIAAVAAVASASSYCDKEMEEMMPMNKCMMWAESRMRRGPYNDGFYREEKEKEKEMLDECCNELGQMSSDCTCTAVKEMMKKMPQLEMKRMMCSLPIKCDMPTACACPRSSA